MSSARQLNRLGDWVVRRWRVTVTAALVLSALGIMAWQMMPKAEDPLIAARFGMLIAVWPGADVRSMERLVVGPIEDELAEVAELRDLNADVRSSVAIFRLRLRDEVVSLEQAWDDVETAANKARQRMPAEVQSVFLDRDLMKTESVVLALTGPSDPLELAEAGRALRKKLLRLATAAQVKIAGDPGRRVAVELDDAALRQVGLHPGQVADALKSRTDTTPGGSLALSDRVATLRVGDPNANLDELRNMPLMVPGGGRVALESVARVAVEQASPAQEWARFQGQDAVVVGAVPQVGIDGVRFGQQVLEVAEAFGKAHPNITIQTVAYQPAKVASRLSELGKSLIVGVFIVALVVMLAMGFRVGALVASVVPMVAAAALALYAASGGVLHQIAVAALVIALGLLVDNAIVVAEDIQRRLDEGQPVREAAASAVHTLALPLAAATATTIASFLPMWLAVGPTAEFTAAIPVMIMLALGISLVFALGVTPALAIVGLRPSRRVSTRARPWAAAVGRFGVNRPWLALGLATGALTGAASFAAKTHIDFFPTSDREQVVVELRLAEGAELEATNDASRRLEAWLAKHPAVTQVSAFVGRSTPFFYYNLPREPSSPHLAQFIVATPNAAAARALVEYVAAEAPVALPHAQVIARRLEQGPPVMAPVEVRLTGDDLGNLRTAADEVTRALRSIPGAAFVRDNQGGGAPTLQFDLADGPASLLGVGRREVALALLTATHGLPAGTWRGGDEPMDIALRTSLARRRPAEALSDIDVPRQSGPPVPLGQVAAADLHWQPSVIHRRNGERTVSILADLHPGATHEAVVKVLTPILADISWPSGIRWSYGGATESSAEANEALGARSPVGATVLVLVLLAQFNSFRRLVIVLSTAPLAVFGIWPGLWLLNLPFGFMALLGAIALIGIVVNGAIVLIDRADQRRAEGHSIAEAVVGAVRERTRPILLTTATTIAGLAPLLFSESTLWPPLAATMMSGLLFGTLLTLVVVPALYRLFFRDAKAEAHSQAQLAEGAA